MIRKLATASAIALFFASNALAALPNRPFRIACIGGSSVSGLIPDSNYGEADLHEASSFPTALSQALTAAGYNVIVKNMSSPGFTSNTVDSSPPSGTYETSTSSTNGITEFSILQQLYGFQPDAVIIQLGSGDANYSSSGPLSSIQFQANIEYALTYIDSKPNSTDTQPIAALISLNKIGKVYLATDPTPQTYSLISGYQGALITEAGNHSNIVSYVNVPNGAPSSWFQTDWQTQAYGGTLNAYGYAQLAQIYLPIIKAQYSNPSLWVQ